MDFTISDTHFFHTNIIKYCSRPFADATEMNETIIANWNHVVLPDDTVYHVGDFALGKREWLAPLRARLNGRIVLILGNHDRDAKQMLDAGIDQVFQKRVIEHDGATIYLAHYPDFEKRGAQYHLYGHVHDKTPVHQPKWARNVSVEVIGYEPISLDRVIADFRAA